MMDEPDFSQFSIAIVGLGLIGGSIAISLKGKCKQLLGIDQNPEVCEYALQKNIVDTASTKMEEIIPNADVIILAIPVDAIIEILRILPNIHSGNPIVMDVGSTKTKILKSMSELPERFDVIGGHPICGKEKLSIYHAEAGLFIGNTFSVTSLARTSENAKIFANQLCEIIGAIPLEISSADHDREIACTSHLPYLVSVALASAIPSSAKAFVGPGFVSTARLSATPSSMMQGVVESNRENVLAALDKFQENLDLLKLQLQNKDSKGFRDALDNSRDKYRKLVN